MAKTVKPRPRNVTATAKERDAILFHAAPRLRVWLMMCSDLAIRSGTAALLGPKHYNTDTKELTFSTKYQEVVRLPVTAELAALFERCPRADLPFVAQLDGRAANQCGWERRTEPLWRPMTASALNVKFIRLKRQLGIRPDLRPHDLRRTTARKVYDSTRDLRLVQALLGHASLESTLWYLQDSLTQVPASTLELAKLNPTTEKLQ